MKNGDLVINGKRVDETDIMEFKSYSEMFWWEFGGCIGHLEDGRPIWSESVFSAYDDKYGEGAHNCENILRIEQIFDKEFTDAFNARKEYFRAIKDLEKLEKEKASVERAIKRKKAIISKYEKSIKENWDHPLQ